MCGIAGILSTNKQYRDTLPAMLESMKHRGPDDRGIFEDENICLGHNRLSIIDLTPGGHQPRTSQCGNYIIVFNGEIYNYKELRKDLPDHITLNSTSDTEVIIELWEKYGPELFSKLRGMFAIAIWDKRDQKIIIARDHMGIKPLYFWHHDSTFIFSSEIKGLLAGGLVPKTLNPLSVEQYLSIGYVIQPDTILDNVFMLPPANYAVIKNNQFTKKQFWDLSNKSNIAANCEANAVDQIKIIIENAVLEETISDRPLGVFLSGGLDSSVIVASLKKVGVSQIKTFSIGFDGDDLSEEKDVIETATFYNTEHIQLQVKDTDVLPHIGSFVNALDQPSVDGLNTWLVSKLTSKHVTVALSGLGGDELFHGYSIDRAILYAQRFKVFANILSILKPIWKLLPDFISNRLDVYVSWSCLDKQYANWGKLFLEKDIEYLTGNKLKSVRIFKKIDPGGNYKLIQRISYLHQRGFMLNRLLRDSDSVSMYNSIEVRFPLIDFRLVNFVFHLKQKWKIKDFINSALLKNYEKDNSYKKNRIKHLLFSAFKDQLPPFMGKRPKRGFKMPIEKWMRWELHDDITKTLIYESTYLDKKTLSDLLIKWENGELNWTRIWAVYIFEKWIKQNIK